MAENPDIVLLPGQGIGPEISDATVAVLETLKLPFTVSRMKLLDAKGELSPDTLDAIRHCGVALKGPFATMSGSGGESVNVRLRRALDLYANVRPVQSFPGVPAPYHDIDLVVIRENLEGLYSGVELPGTVARQRIWHPRIASDAAVSCHTATPRNCRRIAEFAFAYAKSHGRRKVTIAHKANIQKLTDGMFLRIAREVAMKYPDLEHETMIIDNVAHRLALDSWRNPCRFDVIVCLNHHGDILSDLAAGMVGGLGVAPSGQYGRIAKYPDAPYINEHYCDTVAIFEAVHGTAPDIAGTGKANPAALLLSAALILKHLEHFHEADRLEQAVASVFAKGRRWRTKDLGGGATTTEFTGFVIEALSQYP